MQDIFKKILAIRFVYVLLVLIGIGVLLYIFSLTFSSSYQKEGHITCVSTFVDGGGPYYKSNAPFRKKITPDQNDGEKLIVKGKVLKNDCKTSVEGAVIDIWQASEEGSYEDEYYRGKVRSDKDGNYSFETIMPKGYGEGTAYRPPHIHFKIFINNSEIITSQMFFPEAKGKPGFEEAYIMNLESKRLFGKVRHYGYHNIILP